MMRVYLTKEMIDCIKESLNYSRMKIDDYQYARPGDPIQMHDYGIKRKEDMRRLVAEIKERFKAAK